MLLGVKMKIAWEMPVRASVVMSGTGLLYVEGDFVELEGLRNDRIASPVWG